MAAAATASVEVNVAVTAVVRAVILVRAIIIARVVEFYLCVNASVFVHICVRLLTCFITSTRIVRFSTSCFRSTILNLFGCISPQLFYFPHDLIPSVVVFGVLNCYLHEHSPICVGNYFKAEFI